MNTYYFRNRIEDIKEKTTREQALEWWHRLPNQPEIADKYYLGHITIQQHEIEDIYLKEVDSNLKL
jgi:hypothetical protein